MTEVDCAAPAAKPQESEIEITSAAARCCGVTVNRFKSNRDYEDELGRRGHAIPNLLPVFRENLSMFERIWYGVHEVNRELVQHFAANVDKIKAGT